MSLIHDTFDFLTKLLGLDINQTRKNIEMEFKQIKYYILTNPNLTDFQREYQLNMLEQKRQRLLSIQDNREALKQLAEYLNKIDKNNNDKQRLK